MGKQRRAVEEPGFKVAEISFGIVGTAPLLMNPYRPEDEAPDKDAPPAEWAEWYTHRDPEGNVVFPTVAFKRAALDAARCFDKSVTATSIKQNIQVLGAWAPIAFDRQDIHTAWVRRPPGPRGTPAMCHRPMFSGWRTNLAITYNPTVFSMQRVLDIMTAAGITVGIGGGRPGSPSGGIGMGTFALDLNGNGD